MLVVTNLSTADACHQCYVLVISTKFIEIVSPEIIKVNNALEFDAIKKKINGIESRHINRTGSR